MTYLYSPLYSTAGYKANQLIVAARHQSALFIFKMKYHAHQSS